MKRAFLWLVLCSCSRPVESKPAPVAIVVDASVDTSPPARAPTLQPHVVTDADFARRVLYTWTTQQQIADLRSSNRLLVATSYAGSGPSRFILDLEDLVRTPAPGLETARALLLHPSLSRRRYAWPSPFATRMGLSGKSYGDALIRVVLKDDSLIVRFHPEEKEPFRVVDMKGQPATFDPLRVGAVFHVRSSKTATAPFREYVLCNESQIASYEVGTPAIRAELEEEKVLLRALASSVERDRATWSQAIAFENERYEPTRTNLEA
ncbi:MAG: hypothetical protein ACXWUG_07230, partial [Polyangiales bacterium]